MPYGRYPDRVKDFRRWAGEKVSKGKITDSATSTSQQRRRPRRRRQRRRKRMEE